MSSVQLASFETHRGHPVGTGRDGTERKITKIRTDNHVNLGVRGWSPRSVVFMVILTKFVFPLCSGHDAGISQKAIKLRPIAVIKG